MIVITTPTGDIGRQVLKLVVQGIQPIRVIARDPSRIAQEIRQCVEVIPGSHGCHHRESPRRRRCALLAHTSRTVHDLG
jgi:hypothetical protein